MDQSTIDRSWMYAKNLKRHSTEYRKGVINFMNAAEEDRIRRNSDYMCCPCADCKNENMFDSGEDVHGHLIQRGFMEGYTCWVKHGEQESGSGAAADRSGAHNQEDENEHDMFIPSPLGGEMVDVDHDLLQDMLRDVEDPAQNENDGMKFSRLVSDFETPLYTGCKAKHTKLSVTLDLMKLKASSGWTDKSFTDLLGILKAMLPVENTLPETTYEAKQVLCPLGLEVHRIHACPNDCILYHKQYADLDACPVCKASRYKRKKSADEGNKSKRGGPAKVVWYLCIIDRFKRIFANPNEAKLVRWHATERRNDGPRQPDNDIDVFLEPVIDDLEILWKEGVETWDAYGQENFKLRVLLFYTINDYPALGNLSRQTIKGKKACSDYKEHTRSRWLKKSQKMVYMGHRRWLPLRHAFRRKKKIFNGKRELQPAPKDLSGDEVHNMVKDISNEFGKKRKRSKTKEKGMWKKKSIFWRLPYWKDLDVCHCIDLMHVEKNVCESLVGLMLNIPGKTKDGLNARLDLQDMNIRSELQPIRDAETGKVYLPPACHTLSKDEKIAMLSCLKDIKVPSGYSARISKYVKLDDLKLVGMKSHDCHVLITQILPVAIRGILPPKVRHTIQRLCAFFNAFGQKVIDPEDLDGLQTDIVKTLCHLEMFFPLSFFDIMVHLPVHLVKQTKLCGPAFLREMWPFERYMGVLKSYVRNRAKPEGSIIEEVGPYFEEHLAKIRDENLGRSDAWINREHNSRFNEWFKNRVTMSTDVPNETVQLLGLGPSWTIDTWQGYDINGYTFYTVKQDDKSTVQNSGVRIDAFQDQVGSNTYYGRIEEIWELNYIKFKVPLFRCRWVNLRTGVKADKEGFTLVDLSKVGYADEPFVLVKQVEQIFYIKDPSNKKMHIVRDGKRRIVGVDNVVDEEEYNHNLHVRPHIDLDDDPQEPVAYARSDHTEGITL
uniref:Transposon protein, putative, CACTA, En/Spm sub-class n=2 Tax=Oryza sativa subsp. japonica TaxID=39947 RepID=Q53KI5_ORYSJ|nr:transposon protein, putative, CACTA, En/Spm sub-class [Oryza sativa Japonica Group]ABA93324.1 transposon protein, putative, CACTA, En/Spm sub-class [Oryza sativa Japonica Group]